MEATVTYEAFLKDLGRLVQEKRSGTLLGRTEDNHAIIVGLKDGEIILLTYGPHKGEAAIPFFLQVQRLHYRFEPHVLPGKPYPLGTHGILEALAAGKESASPGGDAVEAGPVLERLKGLLTEHIGPIASMLVDEAVEKHGPPRSREDLERIIQALAQDAPPDFLPQARELLASL